MIGTIVSGILPPTVIEISGLPALVALLAPFAVLIFVIVWLRRAPDAPHAAEHGAERRAEPLTAISAAPAPAKEPVDWAGRIEKAEAANDEVALPALYLSLARAEVDEGRHAAAAASLRSSVRAAAKTRNAAVQAEARLELAELARASGDLTTACEHWQIARALFHELKQPTSLADTERLMQKHGCPTDWVLNDF